MKTLVYHAGALGDFICMIPVLKVWRRHDPGGRITLLGKREFGRLARYCALVDEVWDVENSAANRFFSGAPIQETLDSLRQYDTAIIFESSSFPVAEVARRAGVRNILSQPPFPRTPQHIVEYHLSILNGTVTDRTFERPILTPAGSVDEDIQRYLPEPASFVCIHPGSGSKKKEWPLDRFIALADLLCGSGFGVVWITGPSEEGMALPKDITAWQSLPLITLSRLLSCCRLFVGNDSGVSHLAAASGCPSVVLFGASDPAVWSPDGQNVEILYSMADCSPCHPSGNKGISCEVECMKSISVDEAMAACAGMLGQA